MEANTPAPSDGITGRTDILPSMQENGKIGEGGYWLLYDGRGPLVKGVTVETKTGGQG